MRVIGMTGLIGSGKSVVMRLFNKLYDIPTYDSDKNAKEIYAHLTVRNAIIDQLNIDPICDDGLLNKEGLRQVLANSEGRCTLEKIIHKGVSADFHHWTLQQDSELVILESAILFTSGFYKFCQHTVRVIADEETRKKRVLLRDETMTEARYEQIVNIQREEAKAQANKSEFSIDNNGGASLVRQVENIYNKLSTKEKLKQ